MKFSIKGIINIIPCLFNMAI